LAGGDSVLLAIAPIAADRAEGELKHIGYGEPLLVTYRVGDAERHLVFRTMGANWFGHDRRSDRAALALLAADTYDRIPHHLRVADVGAIGPLGELVSLLGSGEFYFVTSYAEGRLYAEDLRAIEARGSATLLDTGRAHALCRYLVELHRVRPDAAPECYARAIRDLIGSGEGVFGITDSYPDDGPVQRERVDCIERKCVEWRPRLRSKAKRLRRTHGDYHPYNVLFRDGVDFTLLDASRGTLGDPADDVAAMTINFLFGGVVVPSSWEHGLKPLWDAFWTGYLSATDDYELLEVVAPFLAWRALVVASPVWYPDISPASRNALLAFAETALGSVSFDPGIADRFVTEAMK
jgi:hypothetical protein